MRTSGEGGGGWSVISDTPGRGVKIRQIFADVLYARMALHAQHLCCSLMLCEGSDCLTLLGPAAVKRQPSRRPPREAWLREMGHNVRQGSERAADKLDNFDQSRHCYRRLIVKYQLKKTVFLDKLMIVSYHKPILQHSTKQFTDYAQTYRFFTNSYLYQES